MCACANAMNIQRAARANGPDMRARMHAAITDTGTGSNDRAGMAACRNAMAIHARACSDRPDMGACAHTMLSDMRAHPDTQYLDVRADGIRRHGREKCDYEERSSEHFHLVISWINRCDNA